MSVEERAVRDGARTGVQARQNVVWTLVAVVATALFVLYIWGLVAQVIDGIDG